MKVTAMQSMSGLRQQMTPLKIPCHTEGFLKSTSYTLEVTGEDNLIITELTTGESLVLNQEEAQRFVFIDGNKIDCTHRRSPAMTFHLSRSRNPEFQLNICKLIVWLEYSNIPEDQLMEKFREIIRKRCFGSQNYFMIVVLYYSLCLGIPLSVWAYGEHWYAFVHAISTVILAILTYWFRIYEPNKRASWTIWPCLILYSSYCLLFLPLCFATSWMMTFSMAFPFWFSLESFMEYYSIPGRIRRLENLLQGWQ